MSIRAWPDPAAEASKGVDGIIQWNIYRDGGVERLVMKMPQFFSLGRDV